MESTCLGGEHGLTRQPRVFHDEVWTVALTKKQTKKNLYTSRNLLPNSVVFSFVEIFKNNPKFALKTRLLGLVVSTDKDKIVCLPFLSK